MEGWWEERLSEAGPLGFLDVICNTVEKHSVRDVPEKSLLLPGPGSSGLNFGFFVG